MKTPAITLLSLSFALTAASVGDVPKKPPLNTYSRLWTDSPFTTKPVVAPNEGPENPLNDYGLIGVSPIGGNNYRATLLNKKKPDEPRIYLETGREIGGFKLLEVVRKNGDPMATTIRVQAGSSTGTVSVDEKLLTLAAPKVAAPPNAQQQPQGQQGNGLQPGQDRQPRPRVVPPPTLNAGGQQPQQNPQQQQPQAQLPQQTQQNNGAGFRQGGQGTQGQGRQSIQRTNRR